MEAGGVERCGGGEVADGCLFCFGGAIEAFEYLLENTAVFAAARPHEAAIFVAVEPVEEIYLGIDFVKRKWGYH